ncbi:MAG: PD-(D/E)XK nuclease family transposase [Clostridium sp.]|nr:PD-(D/E)XK nuclease family transposase [Clostridium sp.]
MNDVLKTRERRKAENLSKIPEFTLMDDTYMNAFFNEQPELVQFVLRIIMNKKNLVVKSSVTQKPLKSIQGRSIILDVDAVDEDESEIDIEVQSETGGAHPKRARFHSSMIDSNALVQNEDFTKLPETYVIFITSKDYFGKGLPLYTINRRIDELDMELFGDDEHIIYVNGEYTGDTPIGKLMHDFKCKDPNEMFYKPLADRAYTLKETEGGRDTVCRIMDEIGKDYAKEMAISNALKMLIKGKLTYEEISEYSSLTLEEVQELAKEVNVNA